ncbi:DUF3237 domain-containing protein [Aspergillus affinis]|uniref:DUF3237 domain-containing protein n=1 Tax=Aspergillus affinis TaxID=1070780 RepID=UPI0022FE9054|nr:uncharacterized protein KD926_008103 [Aspergillus affinis]KAI9040536.1 hypothetical protein KD926_008103 [Aspergillus affinis]
MAPTNPANSPGNAFYPNSPPMRQPGLNFIYRLECTIATDDVDVGAPHGTGINRSIANLTGGTFKGPELQGTILPLGGADWATVVEGTHSMTLDARYTIRTTDNHYLYVRAHGLYRPGPGTKYARQVAENPKMRPPATVTQDDVEFFSHLRIEAGAGKYNWLNGLLLEAVPQISGHLLRLPTELLVEIFHNIDD